MVIQQLTRQEREAFEALDDPDFPQATEESRELSPWSSPEPDKTVTTSFDDLRGVIEPLKFLFPFGEPSRRRSSTPPELPAAVQSQPQPQPQPQSQQQQQQQQQFLADSMSEDESDMEDLVIPEHEDVRLVKVFHDKVKKESVFARPAAVKDDDYEVESVAAIGRRGRNEIMLYVKWKGYPWSESTWEPMRNLSQTVKADLVARWGTLSKIKANSRPVDGEDDSESSEDDVVSRRSKRPRLR